jgi:mono/diheme cytochrome c family protein
VFSDADTTWHLDLVAPDHAGAKRLRKWLTSDVGVRAIAAYAPAGVAMFRAPEVREAEVAELSWDGDADLGYSLSRVHCGRCHAVDEAGRMNSIGSTPSFFVLRTLSDWEGRFQAFYALKPHPAFTQIADVTAPFDEARPSPIVPVEMTLEELENIMAYVALLAPADLGAPLEQK